MDKLFKYSQNVFGVISSTPPQVGEEFVEKMLSVGGKGIPIKRRITTVLESRKSRGTYKDESLRHDWAKVEAELI